MPLMTPEEYTASIRKLRPNIYKHGRLIEDVTAYGETGYTVRGNAELYRCALDPEFSEVLTTSSNLTGRKINRYLSVMETPEDAMRNTYIKRLAFQRTGTCTGSRCAGWSAINALWATTWEMDRDLGTDYHQRFTEWLIDAQDRDISIAGALTDPKGDRTRPPSAQDDPDMNLHIVEHREDGVVIRGAKFMICGTASAHEVMVLPGSGYREADKDYCIAAAVPRDSENLIIIENRQPSDTRKNEAGFDKGTEAGGISQALLVFDNVFVPRARVFLAGEYSYSGRVVNRFVVAERSTMGGCVAGQGDVKIAAAALVAHCNGIGTRPLADKFVEMCVDNETLYGVGVAACALGSRHPSGVWEPNPLLSNVSKINVARLPYDTSVLCQEIAGGIGETGCMPSYRDFVDPEIGPWVQKYLKAASSAESRMKAARLVEYSTIGLGVPGCMHGGGSPDAAKLPLRGLMNLDWYIELGRRLAGIEEDIRVLAGKK
ncbi:MAG: 4-hydroxyphenylacetate 3-hydroxylase [Firmicutes bacterium]|nr:4-hydroxyphenylacetate 3-hydroxylase [Bacillota bacterium]